MVEIGFIGKWKTGKISKHIFEYFDVLTLTKLCYFSIKISILASSANMYSAVWSGRLGGVGALPRALIFLRRPRKIKEE